MGLTPTLQRSPPNIPVPHKLSPIAIFVIFAPNGVKGITLIHGKVDKCGKINTLISYLQGMCGCPTDGLSIRWAKYLNLSNISSSGSAVINCGNSNPISTGNFLLFCTCVRQRFSPPFNISHKNNCLVTE
uniref:Uncharacterized protein n=1 Tax=Glossina palpalis gambiensis TaxID=67801 RepID=A0A1B0B217_9MUSC